METGIISLVSLGVLIYTFIWSILVSSRLADISRHNMAIGKCLERQIELLESIAQNAYTMASQQTSTKPSVIVNDKTQ